MDELTSQQESENIETDRKKIRSIATDYLLHYDAKLKEYKAKKEDFLSGRRGGRGEGHGTMPGKPTEAQAVASVAYDEDHRRDAMWLKAVEIAQRGLSDRRRIFLDVRREAANCAKVFSGGRKPWRIYVQRRYAEEMRKQYLRVDAWINETTISEMWREIISRTVETYQILANKNF